MKLSFPSKEFDDVVAAVCRDEALDGHFRALNELLRTDPAARDEYILRLEVHSRLASEPEMFLSDTHDETQSCCVADLKDIIPLPWVHRARTRKLAWGLALAASLAVLGVGIWEFQSRRPSDSEVVGGKAIAILNRTVDAQWSQDGEIPQVGTLLQPGRLELRAGLAQFVFYSGARVMIEGPAQIVLGSANEISCRSGRLMVEVPPPAKAFRVRTPQLEATGLAASIGLDVRGSSTELQVFKGAAEVSSTARGSKLNVQQGAGALAEKSHPLKLISANPAAFSSLSDLQTKSLTAEARRYTQWRAANGHLNRDPSLVAHIDFEGISNGLQARLRQLQSHETTALETIVGCQAVSGRWADKQGLEFQDVNDCVRLTVPSEFNALTLTAWVRVQGLERMFNSLFMCDGFDPGEIHWMIDNSGALVLSVKGANRGQFQGAKSRPVLSPDQFGAWVQVAVVLDGNTRRITHYFNGHEVSEQSISLGPPYRIGPAELGNWNAGELPVDGQEVWIRNFNGAMDEFCLFSRALNDAEIQELYLEGKPAAGY